MLADLVMRPVQLNDAAALAEIYNYYIKNTTITFEVTEVTADEMRQRIVEITAHHPYWVLEHKGKVIAYCYVHPWRTRAAFLHTKELSVYIDHDYCHQGIGTDFVGRIIELCRLLRYHVLIACVTSENETSMRFHERLGFRHVAHYDEVGWKFDHWIGLDDYQFTF